MGRHRRRWRRILGHRQREIDGQVSQGPCRSSIWSRVSEMSRKLGAMCLRGEDEGLADELALGILGNGNSIAASARSATNESAL